MDEIRNLSLDKFSTPEEPELFSPYDILTILLKRFHWVLVTTTIAFGVANVAVRQMPDLYRAETLILVDPQKVPERYVSSTVSMDVSGRLSTINQQLMSSTRLQRIIDTYDLYKNLKGKKTSEEIIEEMRADIKVDIVQNFGGGGHSLGAFRISYAGRNPALVAQVCNQLASLFIEENLKVREQQAEGTSEFIDTRLDLAKKTLEEQETRLRDYKVKNMGQLPEQSGVSVAQLNGFESEYRAEGEAINHLRQQETYVQQTMATVTQNMAAASAAATPALDASGNLASAPVPVSETLARLKQQKTGAEQSLRDLLLTKTDNFPDVGRTKNLISNLNKQIEEEEKRLASAPPTPMLPVAQSRESAELKDPTINMRRTLQAIQAEIQDRLKKQQEAGAKIKDLQARLEGMPMREQEMAQTTRDAEMYRENYKGLLEKKLSADMAADLEKRQKSERFTILDPARIPERPYSPKRNPILGASFAAGLGAGLAMIVVLELKDRSIKKEGEIVSLGLRILGRIPNVVTLEEMQMNRRRKIRNWALGTMATLAVLGCASFIAYMVCKSIWVS